MAIILSLMMLSAFALVGGAVFLWRQGRPRRQPLLMLLLAAIILANVGIWTLPGRDGKAPVNAVLR